MELKEYNNGLKIKSLKNVKFKCLGGYFEMSGFGLKHINGGWVAFLSDVDKKGNLLPYSPCGGKKTLQSIISSGGFNSTDGMTLLKEMCL